MNDQYIVSKLDFFIKNIDEQLEINRNLLENNYMFNEFEKIKNYFPDPNNLYDKTYSNVLFFDYIINNLCSTNIINI